MLELWYGLVDFFPGSWTGFMFMKQALLAILLVMPALGLLGAVVVNNRMAFFSDVVGHAALTGLAIGALCGLQDPTAAMIGFAALLAVVMTLLKHSTRAAADTITGIIFAMVVSLGVVLLSRDGNFSKYTGYLIGDILTVSPQQLALLAVGSAVVFLGWLALWRPLMLVSLSPSLARSRKIRVLLVEMVFTVLVAVFVTITIPLVGILIINSMLILPAAAARLWARGLASYACLSAVLGMVSGVAGLLASFYWGTAAGATCALLATGIYAVSAVIHAFRR